MTEKVIDLAEQIAPMFHPWFNSRKMHQIDEGGRGSTKTSKNGIKIGKEIFSHPTTNVIVIRRYACDNRKSTYKELKRAFARLGVNLRPRVNLHKSPLGITYGKANIYFAGLDDYESLKGMIPDENTINIIWFFEITQFKGEYEMQQVIATFSRGNPEYFYCLYEYNPHPNISHWTYEWKKKMEQRPDARVTHTTYMDLPDELQKKWLGPVFMNEAETIKTIDYEQYKSIYLGLPAKLKGSIYKRFDRSKHVRPASGGYQMLSIGADYGETDATSFTATGFKPYLMGVDVVDQYWHKNSSADQKDINDYVDDFFDFAVTVHNEYDMNIYVFYDSASKSFGSLLKKEQYNRGITWLVIRPTNKTKRNEKAASAIQERIDMLNLMLGKDDFLRVDPKCDRLITAIDTVEYNDKGQRIDDGTYDIDSMDSFEYSWLKWLTKIRNVIVSSKE